MSDIKLATYRKYYALGQRAAMAKLANPNLPEPSFPTSDIPKLQLHTNIGYGGGSYPLIREPAAKEIAKPSFDAIKANSQDLAKDYQPSVHYESPRMLPPGTYLPADKLPLNNRAESDAYLEYMKNTPQREQEQRRNTGIQNLPR